MTRDFNNEELIQYLLGSLPEAKTEYFDELSFTDEEFSGALNSAEKNLVDAYVQGELPAVDLEKFSSFYLASPMRRKKVEFAKTFQIYAGGKFKTIAAEEAAAPQKNNGFWAGLRFYQNLWQLGLASAALLLMVFCLWLWVENNSLRDQTNTMQAKRDELLRRETELQEREKQLQGELTNRNSTNSEAEKEMARVRQEREVLEQELKKEQARKDQIIAAQKKNSETLREPRQTPSEPLRLSIASFVLLPSLRGNNQLPTISVSPKTDLLAMRLSLESNDYRFYRVALVDQSDNQTVWQSGKIKASGKSLNLRFPAKLIKPRIYSLEVAGVNPTGSAENLSSYPFKVVPQ